MMEMVVTTGLLGAISHAKLQSNHHHQQTNTTLPVVHHDQHYVCYKKLLICYLCRQCLCAGYFMNAAEHIRDGSYVTVIEFFLCELSFWFY